MAERKMGLQRATLELKAMAAFAQRNEHEALRSGQRARLRC
jgi:hypothetical protein